MEEEKYNHYMKISDELEKEYDPDIYISKYLNSEDPLITKLAISPYRFQRHLREQLTPQERIDLLSGFLDNPEFSEEALVTTLRILEEEMDDWDLYYEKLSLFTTHPDKNFRLNTYAYTKCIKYSEDSRHNIYNRIPKRIHEKIISLIDDTLLNDKDIDVKERASFILVEYFRRGFFDNPLKEIHNRLAYKNEKEVDWVLMVPLMFLPEDKYPNEQIFKEFRIYSNENIQMKLCEFLAFKAKKFLLSNNEAQTYMFNLLKREDIDWFTFDTVSFCSGKRFNSLNRDFCIAIASRLEDEDDWIRGDAMYTAKLLIEDAELRKNHPYSPYV